MNILRRWLGAAPARRPSGVRWVVLDVETTGLDLQHDRLLAIAALALRMDGPATPQIDFADSFEAVLRQHPAPADKDNILLHGIGVGEQRSGAPAAEVLEALEQWVGDAPLIAFHAAFDQSMVQRTMKAALGRVLANPWLDLEPVADVLHPGLAGHALDDWLAHFGIECAVRHQAAADTLATAELLLRLWPAARAQRATGFAEWRALAEQRRWLTRR